MPKKVFRVRVTMDVLVAANHIGDVGQITQDTLAEIGETVVVQAFPIEDHETIPEGWYGAHVPFGEENDKTVGEYLVEFKDKISRPAGFEGW